MTVYRQTKPFRLLVEVRKNTYSPGQYLVCASCLCHIDPYDHYGSARGLAFCLNCLEPSEKKLHTA